ncbi:hypothetical protein LTR86_003099 [Recurvomyces mirabilis]|nr:hypothetical protein LTR86_003099 [Recurvomyces mirabilis]
MRIASSSRGNREVCDTVMTSSSTFLKFGNEQYIARPYRIVDYLDAQNKPALLTVFHLGDDEKLNRDFLESTLQHYQQADDVFTRRCLHSVLVLVAPGRSHDFDDDTKELMEGWGTVWKHIHECWNEDDLIPPGPYWRNGGRLYQLYRIRDDFSRSFVVPSIQIPGIESRWEAVGALSGSCQILGVPVPSRLYSSVSDSQPLAGIRIAVKDCFHMAGLRTSLCNKAYHELYAAREDTALCLKRLVDAGARLVGKTHLSSLAWREEPTECIDFPAPLNPRGDGYQSPAGSSSGSGSAIASYSWLDFTIGTDTTGSGRRPALWNGSFALRPSTGSISTLGVVPTSTMFDVPAFFGRDVSKFASLMCAWSEDASQYQDWPSDQWAVVEPIDYLSLIDNHEQAQQIKKFADDLAAFLSVEVHRLALADLWHESGPVSESLDHYLASIQEHSFYYDIYHNFDQFRHDYVQKHGHPPYVSPPTQWLFGIGRLVSAEQNAEAVKRLALFKDWFSREVDRAGERNTLVILPIESLGPRYRDVPMHAPTTTPIGLSMLMLSPALGAPELVVPIGHAAYLSSVTGQREHLPVAVAIMASRGMDLSLIELVQEFLSFSQRPTVVETGRTMWDLTSNS